MVTQRLIQLQTTQGLKTVAYNLRQSRLSRVLRITIYRDNRVTVSAPRSASLSQIERFVLSKQRWIAAKLRENEEVVSHSPQISHSVKEINAYKKQAQALVAQRIVELNKSYGFRYGNIFVRNQKSRWGSCSKKGNLNFNYKIVFLPQEYADYIITHELCHLKEFNHSAAFWKLVAGTVPNYKKLRSELRGGKALSNLL